MKTTMNGSPYHHLAYAPPGWQRSMPLVSMLYPECEIQTLTPDIEGDFVKVSISTAKEGDTYHGRAIAFLDKVDGLKSAVLIACDTAEEAAAFIKLMEVNLPEWTRYLPRVLNSDRRFGEGVKSNVRIVTHDSDPDYGLKMAAWHAAGRPA